MSKIIFSIYIAGTVARNAPAINSFRKVCEEELKQDSFEIQVFNILNDPQRAESHKILAVPTIIRERPVPEKRVIGDTREVQNALKAFTFLME